MQIEPTAIALTRLANQCVSAKGPSHPADVVRHMGAMQAQNYSMSKWAIGVRMLAATDAQIENALDDGRILRTHILRPTWHLVCPEDIRWMTELSAPRIRTVARSRHRQLGITPALMRRTYDLIAKQISDHGHQTRAELTAVLEQHKIPTADNRMAHFLMLAELDGLICSGKAKGRQQTYALLDERAPKKKSMDRDEALGELARRYFNSRSPATLEDFVWWSGLTKTDARRAIDNCGIRTDTCEVDGRTYFTTTEVSADKVAKSTHLLPAFDEFIIAYADRSACLDPAYQDKVISRNGMFWPVIVHRGQMQGLWKRTVKSGHVVMEARYFGKPARVVQKEFAKAAKLIGQFYERKVVNRFRG